MARSTSLLPHSSLLTLYAVSLTCILGQSTTAPAPAGAGYTSPFPILVAPGQLVTMYLQSTAAPDVSAVYWTQQKQESMPVLQVSPWSSGCAFPPGSAIPGSGCVSGLAVTVQIPLDAYDSVIVAEPSSIALSVNGVQSAYFGVQAQPDHVHIFTSCDTIVGGNSCAPLILHANGQPVSYQNPAAGGETLIAYATGLGQTNPPLATGVPAAQASPALSTFNLDFNYRPNALATQPATVYPPMNPPLYAGSTQGFMGLYQINFNVPATPVGLQPCSNLDFIADGPVGGLVLSNLTISIGSIYSFDGAGICVTPGN